MTDVPMAHHKGFTLCYNERTDDWSAPKVDMEGKTLSELRDKLDTLTRIGTAGLPVIYISRGLSVHEVRYVTASRAANQKEHSTKVLVSDETGDVYPVEGRRLILDTLENRTEITEIQALMYARDKQTQEINKRQDILSSQERDIMFSLDPQKTANHKRIK
jgi:hypothetical protein